MLLEHGAGSSSYLPLSVRFHTHDGHRDIAWRAVTRVAGGSSSTPTHPVAFSALGSHATYWRTGDYAIVVKLAGRTAIAVHDHAIACSDCPEWRTWEQLVDVRAAPWYGFGGAWGAAGGVKGGGTTGPLGPSRYKTKGAEPRPDADAGAVGDAGGAVVACASPRPVRYACSRSGTSISRLRILPVGPFGSSSTSQTWRGYL